MQETPHFLTSPMPLEGEQTFSPELIPFRGGFIAWAAVVLIGVAMIFIKIQTGEFQCMTIGFLLFFLLAAVLITFSYWVDTNTVIHATQSYLSYQSPMKKFLHQWDQILKIRAMRVGQSWRVLIVGKQSNFSLRIKSESTPNDHRGRILELPRGDELIRIICSMANLSECEHVNNEWIVKRPT